MSLEQTIQDNIAAPPEAPAIQPPAPKPQSLSETKHSVPQAPIPGSPEDVFSPTSPYLPKDKQNIANPDMLSGYYDPAQQPLAAGQSMLPTSVPFLPPEAKPKSLDEIDKLSHMHLINEEGKQISVPFSQVSDLVSQGKASFLPDTVIGVVDQNGDSFGLSGTDYAKTPNVRLETPSEKAIRLHLTNTDNASGAVEAGLRSFANQYTEGMTGLSTSDAESKGQTSLERSYTDATMAQHPYASTVGGVAGFAGSMVESPLMKGAGLAGEAVESLVLKKAASKVIEEGTMEALPSALRKIVGSGLKYGTEAAVFGAPHAIEQAAEGNPGAGAESIAIGFGLGFGLGSVGKALGLGLSAGAKSLGENKTISNFLNKKGLQLESRARELRDSNLDTDIIGHLDSSTKYLVDNNLISSAEKLSKEVGEKGVISAQVKSAEQTLISAAKEISLQSKAIDDSLPILEKEFGIKAPKIKLNEFFDQLESAGLLKDINQKSQKELHGLLNQMKVESGSLKFEPDVIDRIGINAEEMNALGKSFNLQETQLLRSRLQEATKLSSHLSNQANLKNRLILNNFNDQIDKYVSQVKELFPQLPYVDDFSKASKELNAANDFITYNKGALGKLSEEQKNIATALTENRMKANKPLAYFGAIGAIGSFAAKAAGHSILGAASLPFAAYGAAKWAASTKIGQSVIEHAMKKEITTNVLDKIGGILQKNAFKEIDSKIATIGEKITNSHIEPGKISNTFADFIGHTHENKMKDYDNLKAHLTAFNNNPNSKTVLKDNVAHVTAGDPRLSKEYLDHMIKTYDYLFQNLPKTAPVNPLQAAMNLKNKSKPSDADLASFEKKVAVARNPFIAIDHMANGTLTKGEVETLKTLYPITYKAMSLRVIKEMSIPQKVQDSNKPRINSKAKSKLGLLLGQNLDPASTPDAIAMYQKSFSDDDSKGGQKISLNTNNSNALMSDSQKLQNKS